MSKEASEAATSAVPPAHEAQDAPAKAGCCGRPPAAEKDIKKTVSLCALFKYATTCERVMRVAIPLPALSPNTSAIPIFERRHTSSAHPPSSRSRWPALRLQAEAKSY